MRKLIVMLLLAIGAGGLHAAEPDLRQPFPDVHALVGVRIVTAPGEVIEQGSVVVRDGLIAAIGEDIDIPADARVHEFDDDEAEITLYPGLIDPYVPVAFGDEDEGEGDDDGDDGDEEDDAGERTGFARYPHPLLHPARTLAAGDWPADRVEALRDAGFTSAVLAPSEGVVRGRGALVNLGDGGIGDNMLDPGRYLVMSLDGRVPGRNFPNSLMGRVALLRQALMDARWQSQARAAWQRNPAQPRPDWLPGLEALEPVVSGELPVVFASGGMLDSLRIAALTGEFGLEPWLVGHGHEYQRLDSLVESGLGQILPLDFPEPPDVEGERAEEAGLSELRHWHLAPENPARVIEGGLEVLLTSHPHSGPDKLFSHLATAVERGLDADRALAALTTAPAVMLGIDDRAGRLAEGYMANFVVVDGELVSESPAIREVWIDGRRYPLRELAPPEVEPAGEWEVDLIVSDMGTMDATLELEGEARDLSGTFTVMGTTLPLSEARVSGKRLDIRIDGSRMGMSGDITMYMDIEEDRGRGAGTSPQGRFDVRARRSGDPDEEEEAA